MGHSLLHGRSVAGRPARPAPRVAGITDLTELRAPRNGAGSEEQSRLALRGFKHRHLEYNFATTNRSLRSGEQMLGYGAHEIGGGARSG